MASPNSSDYAALMWSRVRSGQGDSIDALVAEMRSNNIPLATGVYNCLFFSYKRRGAPLQELDNLWKQMVNTKQKTKKSFFYIIFVGN
jgi:hypothetical protein